MVAVKLLGERVPQQVLGAFIVGLALLSFAVGYGGNFFQLADNNTYELRAQFESVEGLEVGSPISLGGIEVGRVESLSLKQGANDYKVMVSFSLDEALILSQDSSASITSNNIFGGKHLRLTQGGSFLPLEDNDEILYTASSVDFLQLLEDLVSRAESKQ